MTGQEGWESLTTQQTVTQQITQQLDILDALDTEESTSGQVAKWREELEKNGTN